MKIGFCGLGVMGKPMCKNLIKAGYDLIVFSRKITTQKDLIDAGATWAFSPKEVAESTDYVITMLPDSPQVKEVVLGINGLIEGFRCGNVLIDMSSIAPSVSRELAEKLRIKGVEMLDAPVSGGEQKAIDATLSIMAGGKRDVFDRCYPILKAMSASVVHMGDIGTGNIAKLANQIIVGLYIGAISEAFVFAGKAGLNPELLYHAIKGGAAGGVILDSKLPMMLKRNFEPGFRLELHLKDLKNAVCTSNELNYRLPLTEELLQNMQTLIDDGFGGCDNSSLVQFYEKLAQIQIK